MSPECYVIVYYGAQNNVLFTSAGYPGYPGKEEIGRLKPEALPVAYAKVEKRYYV